jgi:four helix bundle protein
MSGNYQDLIVWQKAMDMVLKVYDLTKSFPREEVYGLVSQMRRAAISVPSNIAEGKGRHSRKELAQFLFHARGSLLELETQNQIAERLGYLDHTDAAELKTHSSEVGRLLSGMISHFTNSPTVGDSDLTPDT